MKKFIITGVNPDNWVKKEFIRNRGVEIEAEQVSDGYHTMEELYDHRIALFAALCNIYHQLSHEGREYDYEVFKSRLHSDGTMFEGGYFIAGFRTPDGQVTYHMKLKHWNEFRVTELYKAPEYDGHTSNDVLKRLKNL